MTKKSQAEKEEAELHKEAMAATTAELPPKIVRVSEELSCELNDVEWDNKARELAEANQEVAIQEQRKKDVTKTLGADVSAAKSKVTKLSTIVATHREQREVTVEVKYDYELGRVIKTRTDTKEVISDREMTDQERQAQLDLMEDATPAETTTSPFDDDPTEDPEDNSDEEDEDEKVQTYKNLNDMTDAELSSTADELSVDLAGCEISGDPEASRENVKTAIREEMSRRSDVDEVDEGIDEEELED